MPDVPRWPWFAAVVVAVAAPLVAPGVALAQGKFEAEYSIAVARIPVGMASASAEIGATAYHMAVEGRASGLLRLMATGVGSLNATGTVVDGRPAPGRFVARTVSDGDTLDVTMDLAAGNVMALSATVPEPSPDRIELADEHRRGIIDPLTALLLPSGAAPHAADCDRTLPVFDGRRRFDLALAFRRIDRVTAARGYSGAAVVCSVTLRPIAGHRPSSTMVRFLTNGRDIEIAFAPIAETRLLAPFRVTVAGLVGNLTITASRFEVVAVPAARFGQGG